MTQCHPPIRRNRSGLQYSSWGLRWKSLDGEAVLVGQQLALSVEVVPESVQSKRDIREAEFARHHGERRVLDFDSVHGCDGRDFLHAVIVEQGLEDGEGALHSGIEHLIDADFLSFLVVHAEHPIDGPPNPVNPFIAWRPVYRGGFSTTIFKTDYQPWFAVRWSTPSHRRAGGHGPCKTRPARIGAPANAVRSSLEIRHPWPIWSTFCQSQGGGPRKVKGTSKNRFASCGGAYSDYLYGSSWPFASCRQWPIPCRGPRPFR